jgi:NAD(P) transhydrogenase subunit alpha
MSGMNALSGITIVGAIAATGIALKSGHGGLAQVVGGLAIILAAVNVFGGFGVTHNTLPPFSVKCVSKSTNSFSKPNIDLLRKV